MSGRQSSVRYRNRGWYEDERDNVHPGLNRKYPRAGPSRLSTHRERNGYRSQDRGLYRQQSVGDETDSEYTQNGKPIRISKEYDKHLERNLNGWERGIARILIIITGLLIFAYLLSASCQLPILRTVAYTCGRCSEPTFNQQSISEVLDSLFHGLRNVPDVSNYTVTEIPYENPYQKGQHVLSTIAGLVLSDQSDGKVKEKWARANALLAASAAIKPLPELIKIYQKEISRGKESLLSRADNINSAIGAVKASSVTIPGKKIIAKKFFQQIKSATNDLRPLYTAKNELQKALSDLRVSFHRINPISPEFVSSLIDVTHVPGSRAERKYKQVVDTFKVILSHYQENWEEWNKGIKVVEETEATFNRLTSRYTRGAIHIEEHTIDHLIAQFQNEYDGIKS